MMTVHDILERARVSGQRLSPADAGLLFAAAMRLAAAQGATLRSRLVQLDEQGTLHLLPFDDQLPELEPGYLAPELLAADAPRKSEPRVQVYAAGALGFELLTGKAPRAGVEAELPAPLGDIVKLALAPDRRERFGDLTQLYDAVEGAHPRTPLEQERQALAAVRARSAAVSPEKEALARLIAQVGELQRQVSKLSASQRDVLERVERFDDGQRLSPAPKQGAPVALPFLAGLVGAVAVLGAAWALGLVRPPAAVTAVKDDPPAIAREDARREPALPEGDADAGEAKARSRAHAADGAPVDAGGAAAAQARAPVAAAPAPAALRASPAAAVDAGAEAVASQDAPTARAAAQPGQAAPPSQAAPPAQAAAQPGAPASAEPSRAEPARTEPSRAEPSAVTASKGAGAALSGAAAPGATPSGAPASPAPPAPAPAKRSRPDVSPAMMVHAVAQSQVKRGEDALETGRIDEAMQSFRAALENEPTNGPAWRGIATAYSMQGNDAQALQAYEKYLGVAPNARDAGEIRKVMAELKARAKLGGEEK